MRVRRIRHCTEHVPYCAIESGVCASNLRGEREPKRNHHHCKHFGDALHHYRFLHGVFPPSLCDLICSPPPWTPPRRMISSSSLSEVPAGTSSRSTPSVSNRRGNPCIAVSYSILLIQFCALATSTKRCFSSGSDRKPAARSTTSFVSGFTR